MADALKAWGRRHRRDREVVYGEGRSHKAEAVKVLGDSMDAGPVWTSSSSPPKLINPAIRLDYDEAFSILWVLPCVEIRKFTARSVLNQSRVLHAIDARLRARRRGVVAFSILGSSDSVERPRCSSASSPDDSSLSEELSCARRTG